MNRFKPLSLALAFAFATPALADLVPQTLPFSQDWSDIGLITTSDDWSGVPGISGYRGDGLTSANDVDARTVLADGTAVLDVNANQTNPSTFSTGGVAEFQLANPTLALTGSGTADAPFLLIALDTTGQSGITVAYLLRDLDGSADNAPQQVALQFRVGSTGSFTDVPAAYVADATEGPSLAGKQTPVVVALPAAADNQPLVQVRWLTTNAASNDEWVGIDDIVIGGRVGEPVNQGIVPTCPATLTLAAGGSASLGLAASDADSVVNAATLSAGGVPGIELANFVAAAGDGGSASVDLTADTLAAGNYPVTVRFANDDAQSAECSVTVSATGITRIFEIQGTGSTSPFAGQSVTTEGVVTQINNNGYYLQDETGDGDATTSDGVFVFTGGTPTVNLGNKLRLTASVVEFNTGAAGNPVTAANPLTELTSASNVVVLASGNVIAPTTIPFPESVEGELERYEGMLVRIDTGFTASQNFFQGRFGQVTLGAGGRLVKPTNVFRPGTPENAALVDENARRRIVLDDSSSMQNPNPIPYIGIESTLRAGDTINDLVGVIDYGLAASSNTGIADYRLHPAGPVVFTRINARSAAPDAVGGNVRVASFNVLNYFTTLDQTGAACFPSGTRSDCRGADSAAEFTRQQDKIVAALAALDADAVGLIEIENNGNVAVANLVAALNARVGADTYASVGLPTGGTGTDAIRLAAIYKPAKLTPLGSAVSDTDPVHNRPPLAQTFAAANGEVFTLVINHFKSKGSCPADMSGPDADQGDGQGCWNALRIQQAQALQSFISTFADPDVLVMGDLNAYGMEDPVVELLDAGFLDQLARYTSEGTYSFVFDGEAGYLDHALASASLSPQVVGATDWHINADEPSVIDYNLEFKPQDLYTPTPYRSSDHDPAIVGLALYKRIDGNGGRNTLTGTPGDDILTGHGGADTLSGNDGEDQFVYTRVTDGADTLTDFAPGIDRIVVGALLDSLGIAADRALADGHLVCTASAGNAVLALDPDGAGPAAARKLLRALGVTCPALLVPANFSF